MIGNWSNCQTDLHCLKRWNTTLLRRSFNIQIHSGVIQQVFKKPNFLADITVYHCPERAPHKPRRQCPLVVTSDHLGKGSLTSRKELRSQHSGNTVFRGDWQTSFSNSVKMVSIIMLMTYQVLGSLAL